LVQFRCYFFKNWFDNFFYKNRTKLEMITPTLIYNEGGQDI
jgi:hypothetical protein